MGKETKNMDPEHSSELKGHKTAESTSKDSDQRIVALLDSITDGFVGVGFDWRYTYANESAARFLRKSREQLIGEDVFRAFPEAKETVFERGFREALEERVTVLFEAFYEPLESWFECRCYPSHEGISVLFTDTTEKKHRENELSVYHEMVQNANSAIIRWKSDGNISLFNRYAQELFGYSSEEIIGKHVNILVPEIESSGTDLTGLVRDIVNHPELYINNINENVCRDGRRVWMTWTNKAIYDETGQVTEILAVGSDVTKLKLAEETLVRQKAVLSGIARIFRETLTCQTDEALGRVCLSVAEEITGSKFGFIGEIGSDGLLHDIAISDPGWELCIMHDNRGHRRPAGNFKIRGLYGRVLTDGKSLLTNEPSSHPDSMGVPEGHPPLTAFLGVPLMSDGKTIGMISLGNPEGGYREEDRDALEALAPVIVESFGRKRAEVALRETEQKYRELVRYAPTAIYEIDFRNNRFTSVNEAMCAMTGYSREELFTMNPFDITDEEGRALFRSRIARWLNGEAPDRNAEYRIRAKDGHTLDVVLQVTFTTDGDGKPLGGMVIAHDITERKRMENELRKSRDELELRVRERTAELEKANTKLNNYNRRLEELNKELQDFAFVASHDLQEPLRKIQTFGNMLAAKCGVSLDEESGDYINRMQKASARMQSLLNSLLAYSRVTTWTEPIKRTDLARSVEVALSNLEIMIREKNARVEVGYLPTVEADRVQMVQLFQNLIGNALKYQRDGEVPNVRIYSRGAGDKKRFYEICVADNGIGFEEKYLDQIFLPFHRLHGRSSGYEGVGMGLAICKKITERHGGKITAKSELGKGSTFIVTLPGERKTRS
jgi:PAS domain S-box-containing protein